MLNEKLPSKKMNYKIEFKNGKLYAAENIPAGALIEFPVMFPNGKIPIASLPEL